jgi:hypothetical protein
MQSWKSLEFLRIHALFERNKVCVSFDVYFSKICMWQESSCGVENTSGADEYMLSLNGYEPSLYAACQVKYESTTSKKIKYESATSPMWMGCATADCMCWCRMSGVFLSPPTLPHSATPYTCNTVFLTSMLRVFFWLLSLHCNTLQHIATHCNTLWGCRMLGAFFIAILIQVIALILCILEYSRNKTISQVHCNTLQHTATHCNTLQHTATHCQTHRHTSTQHTVKQDVACTLQDTATLCNTLQHTAAHCQTHKHTNTQTRNTLWNKSSCLFCASSSQDTATRCNTLQHTATRCMILQHNARNWSSRTATQYNTLVWGGYD